MPLNLKVSHYVVVVYVNMLRMYIGKFYLWRTSLKKSELLAGKIPCTFLQLIMFR